jgi:DNA-binding Lrp family transcriptional regulator
VAESDNLYSRILREMYAPAWARSWLRQSNAAVAKRLGVDEETVRSAVSKMRNSGFLKSWTFILNPRALGMECESIVVGLQEEKSRSKEKIVAQLKDVDGVVTIFSFMKDPLLRIYLYYSKEDQDLERKIRLVSSICGADQPRMSWNIPFPAHDFILKKNDWMIIGLLLKNSKRSVSETAKAVGVSTRTVTRRLEVMMESNSFFLSPIVDATRVDGFLYHFVISIPNEAAKPAIDAELRQSISRIIFADTSAQHYSVIASICQNISEAEEICDLVRNTKGVNEVLATVFEDIIFVHDWISREIERRIEKPKIHQR